MHKLRRPTVMFRATCDQQVRVVVSPEEGAPPGAIRKITMLVPASPKVSAGLDVNPDAIGLNREYKLPCLPPDGVVFFNLLPEQYVIAVANEGYAELAVIVEYLEP